MTILLRNTDSGHYYAGPGEWAGQPERGVGFKSVGEAAEVWGRGGGGDAEVVLLYSDPPCEIRLTIRKEWFGERKLLSELRYSDP